MAIKRIWHGWTSLELAEEYEERLRTDIFPSIEAKNIPGYRRIELLRRDHDDESEFITIMTFDSIDDVVDFQGEDYKRCYVPQVAQQVLTRWDDCAAHYEVHETREY